MDNDKISNVDALLNSPTQIGVDQVDEYVSRTLEQREDKAVALKEMDVVIGRLLNFVMSLAIHFKQRHLIQAENNSRFDTEYYTRQEVAILYRVSLRTVSNWVISGLETATIGGVVRISKHALEEFIKSNKRKKFHWRSIARKPYDRR